VRFGDAEEGTCQRRGSLAARISRLRLMTVLTSVPFGSARRAQDGRDRRAAPALDCEASAAPLSGQSNGGVRTSFGSSQNISLSRSPHNSSHGPQQRGNLPPDLNRLGGSAALECVGATLGSARRLSAVQATTAVRHRGRLAPAPYALPHGGAPAGETNACSGTEE
jgi:hypothetical protein